MIKSDAFGNSIYTTGARLMLSLKGQKPRNIGEFISAGHLLIIRDKQKHLLRKLSAYGMNYTVLNHASAFGISRITLHETDEGKVFVTQELTPEYLKSKGDFLHFKEQGFEVQVFINRKFFFDPPPPPQQKTQLNLF